MPLTPLTITNLFRGRTLSGEGENSPGVTSTTSPGITSTHIPRNILVFRTITTLLAQIPRATQLERIDYLEDKIKGRSNRRILKISDAFAHIAGGPHDITAVTTNHTVPSTDLQVLVTAPSVPVSLPSAQSHGVWSFLWTKNDQKTDSPPADSPSANLHPRITSPTGPLNLGQRSASDYLSALHEKW